MADVGGVKDRMPDVSGVQDEEEWPDVTGVNDKAGCSSQILVA